MTEAVRGATRQRLTKETSVEVRLALDAAGDPEVDTGIPFFDHMLAQLGRHGGMALRVYAKGDLDVDLHHTIEDVALVLGECLAEALGDKAGIRRFASVSVPLDEALVDVALDLSGRPFLVYEVGLPAEPVPLGTPSFEPQMAEHFWQSFVSSAALTLHIHLRSGRNSHHIVEATFKAVARALRDATRIEGAGVPSTKGAL